MKKNQKDVLIVIPAYNEGKTIGTLLEQLEAPEIAEIADVLVMNDASRDNTGEIVKERNHEVITHIFNLGYGSGLQGGYKYAAKRDYKYLIQMDADGQHDVCNVLTVYNKLLEKDANGKTPDIVLGSRFMEGSAPYKSSLVKDVAYVLFRFIIKLGTGRDIKDPTTGLQGLSRRAFVHYSKFGNFDDKYPDANMIMQMLLLGYRLEEIPAVMHVRKEGVSMHSGFKPIIYMFRMAYSILAVWLRIRVFHVEVEATDEGVVS